MSVTAELQVAAGEKGNPTLNITPVSSMLFLSHSTTAPATSNGLFGALARARIRARTLPVDRQIAAMTHSSVATDFRQTLDIHLHFTAQITFNLQVSCNVITQLGKICLGQIFDADIRVNPSLRSNFICGRWANAVNIP